MMIKHIPQNKSNDEGDDEQTNDYDDDSDDRGLHITTRICESNIYNIWKQNSCILFYILLDKRKIYIYETAHAY